MTHKFRCGAVERGRTTDKKTGNRNIPIECTACLRRQVFIIAKDSQLTKPHALVYRIRRACKAEHAQLDSPEA